MQYCAARGFSVYEDELPRIMADIASDGRPGYQNGLPSEQTVRWFRARNADKITLRKGQQKDIAKLLAEHPAHAATYRDILESVFSQYKGLQHTAENIWNMDETDVDARGQVRKMFCAAGGASTGFVSDKNDTNGPHLTCVVTTSPCGKTIPPFFIVAGKMAMRRWWDPLQRRANRTVPFAEDLAQYFREDWMPSGAGIALSENGSMTMEILPAYIEHFAKHARKIATNYDLPLLLLLDGHKSRKGFEWIRIAKKNNVEVVQSPANTSHYLQSNDQKVNLIFNKAGKSLRDKLVKETDLSPANINFKLIKGVHGHNAIYEKVVKESWDKTGLWPMDFRFVDHAQKAWEGHVRKQMENEPIIDLTVRYLDKDAEICDRLRAIVNDETVSPERRLQRASILLNNTYTANRILMEHQPGEASPPRDSAAKNIGMRPPKGAGLSAVYMTSEEYVSSFAEKIKEKEREQLEKEKKKAARAAEKAQKLAQKEQRKKRKLVPSVGGTSMNREKNAVDK